MIVLETPKYEIVYKVYFDKNTGNILSISNVEQDIENSFVADIDDIRPYMEGILNGSLKYAQEIIFSAVPT